MSNSDKFGRIQLGSAASFDTVELRITDSSFSTVAKGFGHLETELPPGIYEVEMRSSDQIRRQMVRLKPGELVEQSDVSVGFETPMPVTKTSSGRETFRDALRKLSQLEGKPAGLVVFVQNMAWESGVDMTSLLEGWWLEDTSGNKISLPDYLQTHTEQEWAGFGIPLEPGGYTLHVGGDSNAYAQPIWLEDGWTTGLFIPNNAHGPSLDLATVQMIRFGMEWPFDDEEIHATNRASEQALADCERHAPSCAGRHYPAFSEANLRIHSSVLSLYTDSFWIVSRIANR